MTDATTAESQMRRASSLGTTASGRIRALILKEGLQVVRDPSSILIAFVLPVVLLFLFGYGVSLDSNRVSIGLVLQATSPDARSLAPPCIHSRFTSAERR